MNQQTAVASKPPECLSPSGLLESLDRLRFSLGEGLADESQRALRDLDAVARRVVAENAGMADELIGVYEQLGVVFEVTPMLACIEKEADVIDIFVDSLRKSFQRGQVFPVYARSDETAPLASCLLPEQGFDTLIRKARQRRRVLVAEAPDVAPREVLCEVMIGPVFSGDQYVCSIVMTHGDNVEAFHASDMLLLESLSAFCGDVIRKNHLVTELRSMSIAMVRSLVNAVDQKDAYTSGHSIRVSYYAILLARKLGIGGEELQMLQWSALLHDVGKIGIRDDVLKKKGKLTAEEMDHIKEHPTRSYHVAREVPQLAGALDGVLYHHERFDGSGYPEGLVGTAIPLQARILQIADMFDALTTNRSYRSAHEWRAALEILEQEAGTTSDAEILSVFCRMIREKLEGDPQGWEEMTERANQFAGHCISAPDL